VDTLENGTEITMIRVVQGEPIQDGAGQGIADGSEADEHDTRDWVQISAPAQGYMPAGFAGYIQPGFADE
jgi:hypothetical protein